jgi:hypothetical protein
MELLNAELLDRSFSISPKKLFFLRSQAIKKNLAKLGIIKFLFII